MAWKDNPLGIVVDRSMDVDFAALKAQGLSFVVVEIGTGWEESPAWKEQLARAKAVGLPVIAQYTPISAVDDYTFEAPAREQNELLAKWLNNPGFQALVVSMDRYWVGWDLETGHNPVRTCTKEAINYTAKEITETQIKRLGPLGIPVMVRSSDGFVLTYAPGMSAWTDKTGFFLADWRYRVRAADGSYSKYVVYATIPTPVASVADIRTAAPPDDAKNPLVPGMAPSLKFWEFSGNRFILPVELVKGWDGRQKTVKCVLFNGNEDAFKVYLGLPVEPLPEDPPDDPGDPPVEADLGPVVEILKEIAADISAIRQDVHAIRAVFRE